MKLFSNEKRIRFIKCSNKAIDLETEEEAIKLISKIHNETNHRGIIENYNEIRNTFFFPKLKELIHKYINNCDICNLAKYDRQPENYKFEISETPIRPNQIVHGDLFFCYKEVFLTLIDKFSKHLMVQRLNDRNAVTIIQHIKYRFSLFGRPKKFIFDNEFNNITIKDFLRKKISKYILPHRVLTPEMLQSKELTVH